MEKSPQKQNIMKNGHTYALKVTVLEGNDYAPHWEELGRTTVTVGEDQTLPDQPQLQGQKQEENPDGNNLHHSH